MKSSSRIKIAATVVSLVRASTRPGAPSLSERAQSVPRLVRATRDGTYAGTTLRRLGLVGAALAYVASPIDLLPEAFLPILGAADDAVVLSWAIKAFLEETDRFLAWEMGQGLRVVPDAWGRAEFAHGGGWPAIGSRGSRNASPGPVGGVNGARNSAGTGVGNGSRVDGGGQVRPGGQAPTGGTPPVDGSGSTSGGGVRSAATDYVLESVRKRLER